MHTKAILLLTAASSSAMALASPSAPEAETNRGNVVQVYPNKRSGSGSHVHEHVYLEARRGNIVQAYPPRSQVPRNMRGGERKKRNNNPTIQTRKLQKRAFVCAPSDDDQSKLVAEQSDNAKGLCVYTSSGVCEYFPGNGTFSSGASNCPQGMVQGGDPAPPSTTNSAPPPPASSPSTPPPTSAPAPPSETATVPPPTALPPTATGTGAGAGAGAGAGTPTGTLSPPANPSGSGAPNNNGAIGFGGFEKGPGVVGILSVLVGIVSAGLF